MHLIFPYFCALISVTPPSSLGVYLSRASLLIPASKPIGPLLLARTYITPHYLSWTAHHDPIRLARLDIIRQQG